MEKKFRDIFRNPFVTFKREGMKKQKEQSRKKICKNNKPLKNTGELPDDPKRSSLNILS